MANVDWSKLTFSYTKTNTILTTSFKDGKWSPVESLTDDYMKVSTFCGAFHSLLEKLIVRYPYAQLVVMTPLHRDGEEDLSRGGTGMPRQAKLEKYVDAIIAISAYYGVAVLDLFRTGGMQPSVPIVKQLYMPDGLHPNDAGHRKMADRLIGFLTAL